MEKFFIYARKSTDEANRQVLSVESQLHELRELAHKESLTVLAELTESRTAKEPGRPVFNSMTACIERGEAQGILTWHPDRLARNSVDGGRVIYLIDIGKLLYLRFPTFWFEATPQGKFMLSIAFGQSKYYIDNMSENIQRGFRAKARKGIWPCYAPLGYLNDRVNRTILPDSAKAPLVRKTFELYATGRYSLKELANSVNGLGLTTRTEEGKLSPHNYQHMLSNPIYYGLVRWNGEDHVGIHEPIISKELFDRVQRVLRERRSTKKKRPLKDFVFRGLFKCGECGAMITAETQKGHNYYRCTRQKGLCFQPYVREELLKDQVRAEVKKLSLREDWADEFLREIEAQKEGDAQSSQSSVQALKSQIAALDSTLDKLLTVYLAGDILREEYQRKRSDLVGLKMDLKEKVEGLERNSNDRLEPLRDFVNWAKGLNKEEVSQDFRAQSLVIKKACSNRQISARKAVLSVDLPFAFLREPQDGENWRRGRDSNPRYRFSPVQRFSKPPP